MQQRVVALTPQLNIVSYNTLLSVFAKHNRPAAARKLWKEDWPTGLARDHISNRGVMQAFAWFQDVRTSTAQNEVVRLAEETMADFEAMSVPLDVEILNSLLVVAQTGLLMPQTVYGEALRIHQLDRTITLFQSHGVSPNALSFDVLMKAAQKSSSRHCVEKYLALAGRCQIELSPKARLEVVRGWYRVGELWTAISELDKVRLVVSF